MSNELKQTTLINIDEINPQIFFYRDGFEATLAAIKADVKSVVLDVTTEKGKKEIASLAHKIARSKTAIDDLGKDYVSVLKEKSKAVDEVRKKIRDELDALKDEIRKPLTEIEEAEKRKTEEALRLIGKIDFSCMRNFISFKDIHDVEIEIDLMPVRIDHELNEKYQSSLVRFRDHVNKQKIRISEENQQREEIERLKKEKAEAEQREREAKLIADADRKAREETERKNRDELLKAEREKQEAQFKLEQAEKQRLKEIEDLKKEQFRKEEAERQAEFMKAQAEERRIADIENQKRVNNLAKEKLMELVAIDEETAKAILTFIAKGMIPNVYISY